MKNNNQTQEYNHIICCKGCYNIGIKEGKEIVNKQLDDFAEKIRMFGRGRYSPRIQNDLNKEIDKLLKESKE